MSPVKSIESGTTLRNRLNRSIILAIRTLIQQASPDESSQDLAAYIVLALQKIEESVDFSAAAWEKRDYWLKADRFRMDWQWVGERRQSLTASLHAADWQAIALDLAAIATALKDVEIRPNNRIGEPWHGAWQEFLKQNPN